MKSYRPLAALVLASVVCLSAQAQTPKKKKLLFIGEVKGYQHDSVSHGAATIERLGQETGRVGHLHPHRFAVAHQKETRG